MANATINPGICGLHTSVRAVLDDDGMTCKLSIESDCPHVSAMAGELEEVNAFQEISYSGEGPRTMTAAATHCPHPACPVPAGIIKAIEVAAGLALPADACIQVAS